VSENEERTTYYSSMIRGIERTAIVVRYVIAIMLGALCLLLYAEHSVTHIIIAAAALISHNIFAHWALATGREGFFASFLNFAVYLIEISVVVVLTGIDSHSPAFVLYIIFLVGFISYRRNARTIMLASLACSASLGVAALFIYSIERIQHLDNHAETPVEFLFKFSSILIAGWFVANVSQLLRASEHRSIHQAQRLAASENSLRAILNHAAGPILVFDERGIVIEVNDSACAYLGRQRDGIVGQKITNFLFDDGTMEEKYDELIAMGEYQGKQVFVGPDGEEKTVNIVMRYFQSGDTKTYVASGYDITAQKELQEASRHASLHLERLNSELRHVNELRSGFIAGISKKLRSPLSASLGFCEMLLQEELGDLTDEQRTAVTTCRRGVLRAFRVIDEALNIPHGKSKRPR